MYFPNFNKSGTIKQKVSSLKIINTEGGSIIEKKPFNILSIDGGGIKGLYSAVILAEFEREYGKINNYFNLICGISTGGIIALALSAGIPAQKIVDLYTEEGPRIFPYRNKIWRWIQGFKQVVLFSKYREDSLANALREVFGEKRIKDCENIVLIPTSNITHGQPCIIKSDHSEELKRDGNHKLVDVALATAAAPTYFPIQEMETMPETQFADGGLFSNNPSLHGIQEAYRFYINPNEYEFNTFNLLSISTLHQPFAFQRKLKVRSRSFLLWRNNLLALMMDLQSISTHYHIQYLNKSLNGNYIRIGSEPLTKKESKLIDLDLASEESIKLLKSKGLEAAIKWINDPQIQCFFENECLKIVKRGEPVGTM